MEGKISSILLLSNRNHGNSGHGSFSIDNVIPISQLKAKLQCPPAMRVWSSAMKLAKKDLGSSGIPLCYRLFSYIFI